MLAVQGVGVVSGYGVGLDALRKGVASGRTSAKPGRHPDPAVRQDFWMSSLPDMPGIGEGFDDTPVFTRAILVAVEEAVRDAIRRGWRPGPRVGLLLATTRGDVQALHDLYLPTKMNSSSARRYVASLPTTSIVQVMARYGFTGPTMVVNSGCAAGLGALQVAHALMAVDAASDVIVVGAEAGVDAETTLPLAELGPLNFDRAPAEVCRPFERGSAGFVLGEGVAALVTSRRATDPVISVLAVRSANDHHHATSMNMDLRTVHELVESTLRQAGVEEHRPLGVLPHASGTAQCAAVEGAIIGRLTQALVVIGFKPLLGHCRGAAPLAELIALAACEPDELPTLDVPAGTRLDGPRPDTWLQLAFGFGGNAAIAVHRLVR